ncbi:alpha-ribazole kinase [Natronincola peptidivorans]|uniref:Alpha-ribazole kinase n=1 Tax=Natronincola peptidivorans TaxID=426128 RepID=A0A1I0CX53_9FIRM|nr:AIR synthase related protein [Natronincola peptidivorans]SET24240.1 alpha-ribazole kinase [Natronincola peptidivorans]
MRVKRFRDLTLIEETPNKLLVIACDSCGAVGNKERDIVKVPPEVVGYYTARVALMEVLSVGAEIITVIDTLSVEMEPTGKGIIKGIEALLKEASIDTVFLNGSTEENFATCQTAMGITVIGAVEKEKLKANTSKQGDIVALLGAPKLGNEISYPTDEEICSIGDIKKLSSLKEVKEIYPVGSKGILYEADYLAKSNKCSFKKKENHQIDINKSAGPATVVIFTIEADKLSFVEEKLKRSLQIIGELIEGERQ